MPDQEQRILQFRSLLTETLPYEVPVIFSNDRLFASLVGTASPDIAPIIERLRAPHNRFTVPYSYHIAKDDRRTTTLAIVHPSHQLRMAAFYQTYSQSLLDYCSKSDITLRRPVSVTPLFTSGVTSPDATLKLGIPHIDPDDGEIEAAHMMSYFAYGKYNLLSKFVASSEFRKLEKQYKYLRTLDVSRCFFHIYTHSVTWAVKGKRFSKDNADTYTFEGQFDRLMQQANYNETNGIVIGPEMSRIFAEIILQDVDVRIKERLQNTRKWAHGAEYTIRRYVDDYFVFGNSDATLDAVDAAIASELEDYKLFINDRKRTTVARPSFPTSHWLGVILAPSSTIYIIV